MQPHVAGDDGQPDRPRTGNAHARAGNVDAVSGAVVVELAGELVEGFRSGSPTPDEGALSGPVLIGAGAEIDDDVRIDGPSVIGDGVAIGAGSRLREVIALPGAEVPPGSVLVGAIAAWRG